MPYLKLKTNKDISNKEEIVKKLSKNIANELGKPESYVMVSLEKDITISMGGTTDSAAYVELKSIGLASNATAKLSEVICSLLSDIAGISSDRIYIVFSDVERNMWGWNGDIF
ncbi:MAG: phenylpyruvate tautomerase MIF-related protein [Halanaerobiaceae bacterium]